MVLSGRAYSSSAKRWPQPAPRYGHFTSGRQAHQDRLHVAAGLQPEQRAAVVDQVELHVAPAPHQLVLALRLGPGLGHAAADDPRERIQERQPDIADEREIGGRIATEVVVEEDPAEAAGLATVRQEEVAVAPRLELRIVGGVVPVAGRLERGMEIGRVLHRFWRLEPHRGQVAAAAEPALRGDQHPRVEVRRRHARALHVRHQAYAAGPEARVLLGAGYLAAKLRAELAPDGGNVHPHLLEHASAHHARQSPATSGSLPGASGEPARSELGQRAVLRVLDRLEFVAEAIAQRLEPRLRRRFQRVVWRRCNRFLGGLCHQGLFPAHRQVSPCRRRVAGVQSRP